MEDDKIKEAFSKVKKDISDMREELNKIKEGLFTLNEQISNQTQNTLIQTDTSSIPTHTSHFKPLKAQNYSISTGNAGVPTDRQTDRQTDRHIENQRENRNPLDNAIKILDSLDSAKKEIRLRFKRLTDMEFLVFTTLYQMEEEDPEGHVSYNKIASKLSLTESSIRDYVGKLIKKEIPIEKKKVNNKAISLHISQNLKKVASLSTILQLRDI